MLVRVQPEDLQTRKDMLEYEDIKQVQTLHEQGKSFKEIAVMTGRTYKSVYSMLHRIGVNTTQEEYDSMRKQGLAGGTIAKHIRENPDKTIRDLATECKVPESTIVLVMKHM